MAHYHRRAKVNQWVGEFFALHRIGAPSPSRAGGPGRGAQGGGGSVFAGVAGPCKDSANDIQCKQMLDIAPAALRTRAADAALPPFASIASIAAGGPRPHGARPARASGRAAARAAMAVAPQKPAPHQVPPYNTSPTPPTPAATRLTGGSGPLQSFGSARCHLPRRPASSGTDAFARSISPGAGPRWGSGLHWVHGPRAGALCPRGWCAGRRTGGRRAAAGGGRRAEGGCCYTGERVGHGH